MSRAPVAGLALSSLTLLVGCRHAATIEKSPTPVRIVRVEERAAPAGARYSATIEPQTRMDASFKVGGYVVAIHQLRGADGRMRNVQEGDRVSAGTVLASVRQSDYTAKVNESKSQLLKARAGVDGSRFQLAQAEAPYEQAKLNWTRAQTLYGSQSLTKPDLDNAKANFDAAAARLEAAKVQVSAMQADVSGATAALSEAETALGDSALKAPISGIVMQRKIEVGSLVGPGAPGFTLADLSSVKAAFGVPDVEIALLHLGQVLRVSTEALPGVDLRGRVTSIAPAADARTRVFAIEVTIPNTRAQLKPGMVASIDLREPGMAKLALAVPLTSVVKSKEGRDRFSVFVLEGGDKPVARQRTIRLGEALGDAITVLEGLSAGDRIVSSGAFLLVDGERVQVIP